MCQYGQGVVRGLLEEFDERLKGFVVWLPTMPGDSLELARREAATFEKFSVSHAWDPERRLGDLYAKLLNLGSVAWDVYFLYAPGVKWEGVEPPQPTFWMHQLPPEVGVDEDLYLNPTRMFREILKMLGGEVLPSRSDLGLMLHGKGLFNVTRERTQYNLSDIRQAFDDSKVQSDPAEKPHLLIVGGGSAAFAATLEAHELGARVTLINDGLPTGGTCVNVGCVPSKTLIRAAEAHHHAARHNFAGIESSSRVTDFKAIISQKRQLVEGLRQAKYIDLLSDLSGTQLIKGRARLTSPNSVEVNGQSITADRLLIATGVRPFIPPVPGLEDSGYLTNESAFELEELPESLIVLGGRYIALETAQLFSRLGSQVTILQRSPHILPTETTDLTDALTGYLSEEGIQVVTGVSIERVDRDHDDVVVQATVNGTPQTFQAAHILVATGRKPNTDEMGLEDLGVNLDSRGFLEVDQTLQTSVEGIYGAGDIIGEPMYVYTAAYEGALVAKNAITGEATTRDYTALPWVIFTDPQVAGVGMGEQQAAQEGIEVDIAKLPLSQLPRSLAARDTRGFIKLIRDRATDKLVGGRILAPEGSELLMEISLAIKFGITVKELTSSFHPYLTLSEGVKLAAIAFEKDVTKLSCCAA